MFNVMDIKEKPKHAKTKALKNKMVDSIRKRKGYEKTDKEIGEKVEKKQRKLDKIIR